jgi:LPXTG-motif cell wall-anchored protein
LAAISGWAALTAGIASLLPHTGARALWLASTGLFLISLSGWKFLRRIATEGLYVLTRKSNA